MPPIEQRNEESTYAFSFVFFVQSHHDRRLLTSADCVKASAELGIAEHEKYGYQHEQRHDYRYTDKRNLHHALVVGIGAKRKADLRIGKLYKNALLLMEICSVLITAVMPLAKNIPAIVTMNGWIFR